MEFGTSTFGDTFGNELYEDDYKSQILLKELYLDNFKSFKNSKFEFGKLNCLIAPNNTGKSNLVEAIEFLDSLLHKDVLRAVANIGLQNVQNFHYPAEKKVVLNAKINIENRVIVTDELIDYKLELLFLFSMDIETRQHNIDIITIGSKIKSITIDKADLNMGFMQRLFISFDKFIHNLGNYTDALNKKNYRSFDFEYNHSTLQYNIKAQHESTVKLVETLFELTINKKNELLMRPLQFTMIFNKSSLFTSHYFHPNTIKEVQTSGYNHLLENGTNLSEYLGGLDKDTFEDISTSLIGEVELISSLELRDNFVTELLFNEEVNGVIYPIKLQKVSDGTVHFVSIMSALIGNQNSIGMMIEEPERHMHMKVLSYILNTMRDDDKQIFFTTHSTEMLSELELDEIIFMFRDYNGDTKGVRAKEITNIKKIMKIYKNDLVEMIRIGILDNLEDEL